MRVSEQTLVDSLKSDALDDILAVREQLGADLAKVRIITRTWNGVEVGDGDYMDQAAEMHPAPGVKDLSHSYRVAQGGAFQQGDLMLTMISKNKYPEKLDVDLSCTDPLVEKFYEVNGNLYRVITVVEKYVVWDVQVRRLTDQTRRSRAP
jgi:hypothetical protein